jgi:glutaredoxin-related protein
MEDQFIFTVLTNKKDYQKKRLQLVDSLLACLCYDKSDLNSNNEELLEFLVGIKENFGHKIEIALLEKSSLDENFRNDAFKEHTAPYFLICEPHNVDATPLQLNSFDQFELYKYFEEKANFFEKDYPILKANIFKRIKTILDSFPIVIFIKGTPFKPFCKYSKQFMELIRPLKIRYMSYDIFADDNLRTFLRLYSGWKTYPQIYINGKIIGGVDVLKGLIDSGEVSKIIPEECSFNYVLTQTKKVVENELVVFGRVK